MDRQVAQRRPVRKAGMIEFPGGAFSCMVRDLSEAGAALDMPSSIGIPEHFTMLITERGGDGLRCRSVWREDRQIGVAFETVAQHQSHFLAQRRRAPHPARCRQLHHRVPEARARRAGVAATRCLRGARVTEYPGGQLQLPV